jgi:hypothetical protein
MEPPPGIRCGACGVGMTRSERYRYYMADRRRAGSWLNGTIGIADDGKSAYPGEQLGLPATGPGSVAHLGRRLAALFIDWIVCMVIALAIWHSQAWILVIFAAETYVLVSLTGLTVGKRVMGIRVARLDGKPVGFLWGLVRTLLLLTVILPLITDQDQRGLHDRASNTVEIRI